MYDANTEVAKSTAVHYLAIILEVGSCKPSVTKLPVYSTHFYDGHNYARYETRKGYLVITRHHNVMIILVSECILATDCGASAFIVVSQARLSHEKCQSHATPSR